jgi:hypothetical protein
MPNDPEVPPVLQAVQTETAQNAALKEAVKRNASNRRAGAQAEQPVIAPLIPMSDDPAAIQATLDAESEYARQIEQAPALDESRLSKLDETYLCYVKCRGGHEAHHPPHGIYLVKHPATPDVPYTGWYSRYKKAGERYYPNEVMCQACALENRSMPLEAVEKTSPEGDIKINPRFLMRRARDPKRAAIEGEHRVFDRSLASTNGGRRDALAKAKAAGYEVHDQ